MRETRVFFWDGEQVHEVDGDAVSNEEMLRYYGCFCVDLYNGPAPKNMYGKYTQDGEGWRYIPFEQFPADFKIRLLVMGVS